MANWDEMTHDANLWAMSRDEAAEDICHAAYTAIHYSMLDQTATYWQV